MRSSVKSRFDSNEFRRTKLIVGDIGHKGDVGVKGERDELEDLTKSGGHGALGGQDQCYSTRRQRAEQDGVRLHGPDDAWVERTEPAESVSVGDVDREPRGGDRFSVAAFLNAAGGARDERRTRVDGTVKRGPESRSGRTATARQDRD